MSNPFGGAPAAGGPASGGFSFGAGVPAAGAPAAGVPAFNLGAPAAAPSGSGSTAAPASGAPSAGAPAFNFGAPAVGAPTGGGFGAASAPSGFGATTAPTTGAPSGLAPALRFGAPAPAAGAPAGSGAAPALSGFGAAAALTGTSSTGAPATGAAFSNTPAPSTFSFASTPAAPGAAALVGTSTSLVQSSDYNTTFPGQCIWEKVSSLLAAPQEEWTDELKVDDPKSIASLLLRPQVPALASPNQAVRQQLSTQLKVLLTRDDGGTTTEAALTPNMLHDILALADDLRISEPDAICLYAAASTDKPARDLYFHNRHMQFQSLLSLLQERAANPLVSAGLISNLLQFVRDSSQRVGEWRDHVSRQQTAAPCMQWHLEHSLTERQMACECLFFIAYHTQWTADEVAGLVDLIRDLTNNGNGNKPGLPILDPIHHVPDAYENSTVPWMMHSSSSRVAKDPFAWQRELVEEVWKMGQPQLLRCISTLVMTVLSALDTKTELVDRSTNEANGFGVVRSSQSVSYAAAD